MKVKVLSSSEDAVVVWYGNSWVTRYCLVKEVEKEDNLIENYYKNGVVEFEEMEIEDIETSPEIREEIQFDVENRQAKLEEYEI